MSSALSPQKVSFPVVDMLSETQSKRAARLLHFLAEAGDLRAQTETERLLSVGRTDGLP